MEVACCTRGVLDPSVVSGEPCTDLKLLLVCCKHQQTCSVSVLIGGFASVGVQISLLLSDAEGGARGGGVWCPGSRLIVRKHPDFICIKWFY